MDETEVEAELRGERARRELSESEADLVVLFRDPFAGLDEVAPHVADERDGTAESDRAELEEVRRQLPDRIVRSFTGTSERPPLTDQRQRTPPDGGALIRIANGFQPVVPSHECVADWRLR